MCFFFMMRFGRVLWLACGVAAVVCMAAGEVVAQAYFSSPKNEEVSKPLPWQERGLRAALEDASPEVRSYAVEFIAGTHWADKILTLQDVLPLLHSADEKIRVRAAQALGPLGAKDAAYIKELLPLLHSQDEHVVHQTLNAMSSIGRAAGSCAHELLPLLQSPDEWMREHAAKTLGHLGPEAVPHAKELVRLLRDESYSVIKAAAEALALLGHEDAAAIVPLLRPHLSPQPAAPRSPRGDPFGAAPARAAAEPVPADETQPATRPMRAEWPKSEMVKALGCMGAAAVPLAAPVLAPLLTDGDSLTPRAAELALFRLGNDDPAAMAQALLPMLQAPPEDPNLDEVVDVLGLLDPEVAPVVVPALLPLLQPKPPPQQASATQEEKDSRAEAVSRLRSRVVEALGHLSRGSDPAAVGALFQLLKSPELSMRRAAAHALGRAGEQASPQVVRALLRLLKDADKSLRSAAISALTKAGRNSVPPEIMDTLRSLLKDPRPEVRDHASYELDHLRESGQSLTGTPTLSQLRAALPYMLRDAAPEVRVRAMQALEQAAEKPLPPEIVQAILPLLKDPDYDVRADVLDALEHEPSGTSTTPQIVSALRPLLEDSQPHLRCSAALILHRLGVDAATCLQAVKALLQGPAMPHQANALRVYAELAPGLPAESVVPALLPLLRVPDQHVGFPAADILQKFGPRLDPYIKEILPLFQDPSSTIKWAAANALASPGPDSAPLVVSALLHWVKTDDDMRTLAVNILGGLDPATAPQVLPALAPLLRLKDDHLRTRTALALGRMGHAAAPAVKDLIAVLDDVDPSRGYSSDDPRYPAAEALGQLGPGVAPVVLPALLACFEKDDAILGYHASLALQNLGPQIMPAMLSAEMARWHKAGAPPAKNWSLDEIDRWGNRSADPTSHCAALAALLEFAGSGPAQRLRFHLHLWSGHSDELLLSLRWLGKPAAAPMPANGAGLTTAEQQAVLGMLLKLWPHSAPHPALRQEMAWRIADVANRITAAPEEKVGALLKSLDEELKTDSVPGSQEVSGIVGASVESALVLKKAPK